MCQQVNKAKNTADKQHSPQLWPLLTAFVRSEKKSFSFIVIMKQYKADKYDVLSCKERLPRYSKQ